MPAEASRPITIKGLTLQFDVFCAPGDAQAAADEARKFIENFNSEIGELFPDACPQLFGGDNVKSTDVELGEAHGGENFTDGEKAAIAEALGNDDFDELKASQAIQHYAKESEYGMTVRLQQLEHEFNALGGRSVLLAEKLDELRTVLAVRKAAKDKQTNGQEITTEKEVSGTGEDEQEV